MPIYEAEFIVTTYYTVNIDAESHEQAKDAAESINFDDLEINGVEEAWRRNCDFNFMSKKPVIQGEGKIFSAIELLDRYEES